MVIKHDLSSFYQAEIIIYIYRLFGLAEERKRFRSKLQRFPLLLEGIRLRSEKVRLRSEKFRLRLERFRLNIRRISIKIRKISIRIGKIPSKIRKVLGRIQIRNNLIKLLLVKDRTNLYLQAPWLAVPNRMVLECKRGRSVNESDTLYQPIKVTISAHQ